MGVKENPESNYAYCLTAPVDGSLHSYIYQENKAGHFCFQQIIIHTLFINQQQ